MWATSPPCYIFSVQFLFTWTCGIFIISATFYGDREIKIGHFFFRAIFKKQNKKNKKKMCLHSNIMRNIF